MSTTCNTRFFAEGLTVHDSRDGSRVLEFGFGATELLAKTTARLLNELPEYEARFSWRKLPTRPTGPTCPPGHWFCSYCRSEKDSLPKPWGRWDERRGKLCPDCGNCSVDWISDPVAALRYSKGGSK